MGVPMLVRVRNVTDDTQFRFITSPLKNEVSSIVVSAQRTSIAFLNLRNVIYALHLLSRFDAAAAAKVMMASAWRNVIAARCGLIRAAVAFVTNKS